MAATAEVESLYCRPGQHAFTRDKQRGRKPDACPLHGGPGGETVDGETIFAEEELAQDNVLEASGFRNPTFTELKTALQKSGPEGILASARHLPQEQYARLAKMVKDWRAPKKVRR